MTLNAGLTEQHYWQWVKRDSNLGGTWDPKKGVRGGGMREPGKPSGARVITLQKDEAIFRWASTKVTDATASPWWSSKRAAQGILRDTLRTADDYQTMDTSGAARSYSGVARAWSDLGVVVVLRLLGPVACFIGMGKPVEDDLMLGDSATTTLYEEELQLYIPNMVEAGVRPARRSSQSLPYFRFERKYQSVEFSAWHWSDATKRQFGAV